MGMPVIFGTPFSTYVRTVRMVLEEKSAPCELVDVKVIAGEHKQPEHLARNPFGTVPAFEHDGFKLYETGAIIRYVDQVFPGTALTPGDPHERARVNQIISIIDYHGYGSIIGQIAIQRLFTQITGKPTDLDVVAAGSVKAKLCLSEFERLLPEQGFLASKSPSLADLYLIPIIHYLMMTPEKTLMAPHAKLGNWWTKINERESVKKTAPQFG
jgi:glutathione S-transferase